MRKSCQYCEHVSRSKLMHVVLLQPQVRKQHNAGYKHKVLAYCTWRHGYLDSMKCPFLYLHVAHLQANVRNYFMQFEESQTQSLIDSKIMEFEMKSRQGLQVKHELECMSGCLNFTSTICFQHCRQIKDAAASHMHVSETGDASLSHTLRNRCCTSLALAICCPIAQRRADM